MKFSLGDWLLLAGTLMFVGGSAWYAKPLGLVALGLVFIGISCLLHANEAAAQQAERGRQ